MRKKRPLLKAEWRFSPFETSFSNQGVLDKNALKDTPGEKTLHNQTKKNSEKEDKIINLDNLEIAILSKKRTRMEIYTTPGSMIRKSAKIWSHGSRLQQGSRDKLKTSPATAVDANKKEEEVKKAPKKMPDGRKEESGPVIHSSFDSSFSIKLPPGCIEPSITIDEVKPAWVIDCHWQACVRKLESDSKYEHKVHFFTRVSFEICSAQTSFRQIHPGNFYDTWRSSAALQLKWMRTTLPHK